MFYPNNQQPNTKTISRENFIALIKFVAILTLSVVVPLFHSQPITGPIVNALLFIATIILGWKQSVLIALVPSAVALSVGLLPVLMIPIIPFIMLSNVLLIFVFNFSYKKNYWLAVVVSSILKFIFLFAASRLMIYFFIHTAIAKQIALMFSWPQLWTALAGGIIAFIFLKSLKRI